jgi:predicted glycosyltransferase
MRKADFRVLIYSQDGFGLGHLRRNLNISQQINRCCPSASILLIADSPVAPFFKLPPKCDFVKLPTIVKVDMGVWRANHLSMDYREVLKIRSEIIQNVFLSFRPHILLVDHMPHGVLGELAVPLEKLKRLFPETRVILGLRDILGAPEAICQHWLKERAYDTGEMYYDCINVYGSPDIYDVTTEYQFPENLVSKTTYCGYVSRQTTPKKLNERALSGLFGKKREWLVLVCGGGGADASFFMDKFIDATRTLSPHIPYNAIICTGPFMHPQQSHLLKQKAKGLPVHITHQGQDNVHLLNRADLVISMAGYNTITEIMRYRKKAIVIPRPGPSAEQTMRTRIMSERGFFSTIHPTQLTAKSFSEAILQKLEKGAESIREDILPDLNGAAQAATSMLSQAA